MHFKEKERMLQLVMPYQQCHARLDSTLLIIGGHGDQTRSLLGLQSPHQLALCRAEFN